VLSSVVGLWTDLKPAVSVCVRLSRPSAIASARTSGPGDGLQPDLDIEIRELFLVSYASIAAALMLDDISLGERLVAFSLASFANRENVAWPGTPAAAARAGLSRSRYLHARDLLLRRDLISITDRGGGRGRSTTIALEFANAGPWFDGEVNPELFEVVLGYSPARGSARQLLAAIAAMANGDHELLTMTTQEIRVAAGLADSTYRRARAAVLRSGDLILERGGGGRGNTNRWRVRDPREARREPVPSRTGRVAPVPGSRPLLAAISSSTAANDDESRALTDRSIRQAARRERAPAPAVIPASDPKGAQTGTVSPEKGPDLTGVSGIKGAQSRTVCEEKGPDLTGVCGVKGARSRTVSQETPPETPPPNARAGKEPQNLKTKRHPPYPPEGGNTPSTVLIEETYRSERGRQRRRTTRVELCDVRRSLGMPAAQDHQDWRQLRDDLARTVSDTTFEIWLEPLQLIAIDSTTAALVLSGPSATLAWLEPRFGRLIGRCAERIGRRVRIAAEIERQAMTA